MTFLDTVDGKLARVTVTSSRVGHVLDHGVDLIHPPLWYIAWGLGLATFAPGDPRAVGRPGHAAVIVVGYVHRAARRGRVSSHRALLDLPVAPLRLVLAPDHRPPQPQPDLAHRRHAARAARSRPGGRRRVDGALDASRCWSASPWPRSSVTPRVGCAPGSSTPTRTRRRAHCRPASSRPRPATDEHRARSLDRSPHWSAGVAAGRVPRQPAQRRQPPPSRPRYARCSTRMPRCGGTTSSPRRTSRPRWRIFARHEIDVVTINGGDGTIQAAMTAVLGERIFESRRSSPCSPPARPA